MPRMSIAVPVGLLALSSCASHTPVRPVPTSITASATKTDLNVQLVLLDELLGAEIQCAVSDIEMIDGMIAGATTAVQACFANVCVSRGFGSMAPDVQAIVIPRVVDGSIEGGSLEKGTIRMALEWRVTDPRGNDLWVDEVSAVASADIGSRLTRSQRLHDLSTIVLGQLFDKSVAALDSSKPIRSYADALRGQVPDSQLPQEASRRVAGVESVTLETKGKPSRRAGAAYFASTDAAVALLDELRRSGVVDAVLPLGLVPDGPGAVKLAITFDVEDDTHGGATMARAALAGFMTLGLAPVNTEYSIEAAVRLTAVRSDGARREWLASCKQGKTVWSNAIIEHQVARSHARAEAKEQVLASLVDQVRAEQAFFAGP